MKRLVLGVALSVLAAPAFAEDMVPVSVQDLSRVVQYLQIGGTHAEAGMLAERLIAIAQAEQAKRQAAGQSTRISPPANPKLENGGDKP